jgi:hypothetical protein
MGTRDSPAVVHCATHGEQPETLVCHHVLEGLRTKTRVGFVWTTADPANPRPDAWCQDCNARVAATGGEWVGDALANLGPQTLCGACYDTARAFHMGGDPWS